MCAIFPATTAAIYAELGCAVLAARRSRPQRRVGFIEEGVPGIGFGLAAGALAFGAAAAAAPYYGSGYYYGLLSWTLCLLRRTCVLRTTLPSRFVLPVLVGTNARLIPGLSF